MRARNPVEYGTRCAILGVGTGGCEGGREGLKGARGRGGETFLSQIWLSESRTVMLGGRNPRIGRDGGILSPGSPSSAVECTRNLCLQENERTEPKDAN